MKKPLFVLAVVLLFGWNASEDILAGSGGNHPIGFSLTDNEDLSGKAIGKEEIVTYEEGSGTRLLFSNEGFAFMIGDNNGDGIEEIPSDIDAFHVELIPGSSLPSAMFFSTKTSCIGVHDGDLFRFHETGGIELYMDEPYFVTVSGASDGNVDVNAFTRSSSGQIYFSFADDENSSLLSGSQPGIVKDGCIICINTQGTASVLYTEDMVSDMVSNALGKQYSIIDVQGLSYDDANEQLLFSVQSPTSHDGSVFSDQGGGTLLAGYDEASFGFSGEVEIDALSLLPVLFDMRSIEIEPRYPRKTDMIIITVSGGVSGEPYHLFVSGDITSSVLPPFYGGFGSFLLDMSHPYFSIGLNLLPYLTGVYNSEGTGEFITTMPSDPSLIDFRIQAVDPVSRVFSHPFTLEFNQ